MKSLPQLPGITSTTCDLHFGFYASPFDSQLHKQSSILCYQPMIAQLR